MNKDILMVVDAVSNEKGVEKEIIFEALEAALASASPAHLYPWRVRCCWWVLLLTDGVLRATPLVLGFALLRGALPTGVLAAAGLVFAGCFLAENDDPA